jgi:hypothetical protein
LYAEAHQQVMELSSQPTCSIEHSQELQLNEHHTEALALAKMQGFIAEIKPGAVK